jgi:two-component system invasion response regulator UvrY
MKRVLLADDHPLVRGGVAQLLRETCEDFEVAGEAQDYIEVMKALRTMEVDVLVLDVDLPGKSGIEILKLAKKEFPRLAVLLYSMHPESEYGVRALKAGASGYVSKSATPEELVAAIRAVSEGKKHINAALAQALAERVSDDSDRPPHELLSDREFQTLRLIASGKRLSEIADALALSPKTVSVYRARVLEKMRMANNAELTHYALKNGLVD